MVQLFKDAGYKVDLQYARRMIYFPKPALLKLKNMIVKALIVFGHNTLAIDGN